jgi:hypothetical protein
MRGHGRPEVQGELGRVAGPVLRESPRIAFQSLSQDPTKGTFNSSRRVGIMGHTCNPRYSGGAD